MKQLRVYGQKYNLLLIFYNSAKLFPRSEFSQMRDKEYEILIRHNCNTLWWKKLLYSIARGKIFLGLGFCFLGEGVLVDNFEFSVTEDTNVVCINDDGPWNCSQQ